jgi:Bacterial Ig-like domain (group 3)
MGRASRLELVAGLGIALALPALVLPALALPSRSSGTATETTLAAETRDQNGHTQATLSVSVMGRDGLPASGAVVIEDEGKSIAGAALNAEGRATSELTLAPGDHHLTAQYAGDETHLASASQASAVAAVTGTTPGFTISVAPGSLSLAQGQAGTVIASVTPVNSASLTAPMFVTLSCAGLPDQALCTFTPQNVQILPNATNAVTSVLVVTTSLGRQSRVAPVHAGHSNTVALCILLPGALGLAGLAFGARRRVWLSRISVLGFLAVVTVLGTAGCNPLYDYKNHGPSANLPTPAGSYTLLVTAQSSNGVTAVTQSTTMGLTVTQ